MTQQQKYRSTYIKLVPALFAELAFVFICAGTLNYWQGGVFSIATIGRIVIALKLFKNKPYLIIERFKFSGMLWWDKIFAVIYFPLGFFVIAFSAFDAGRLHWTQNMSIWIWLLGFALFMISNIGLLLVMSVNRFFYAVIRITKGQKLIDSGPYSVIRHPGYALGFLSFAGIPLCLGSYYGLIPAAIASIMLIVRAYFEEKFLQKELKGYYEYMKRVKYRFIPGVW